MVLNLDSSMKRMYSHFWCVQEVFSSVSNRLFCVMHREGDIPLDARHEVLFLPGICIVFAWKFFFQMQQQCYEKALWPLSAYIVVYLIPCSDLEQVSSFFGVLRLGDSTICLELISQPMDAIFVVTCNHQVTFFWDCSASSLPTVLYLIEFSIWLWEFILAANSQQRGGLMQYSQHCHSQIPHCATKLTLKNIYSQLETKIMLFGLQNMYKTNFNGSTFELL